MNVFIKNYKFKVLFITLITIFGVPLSAQVTIGSLDKPEKYVTLKIDNEDKMRGLRLNRLSEVERNTLPIQTPEEKIKARGLLIYNQTENRLEYFDGEKWVTFSTPYTGPVLNGLTNENDKVRLGGKLSEETVITQGQYPLNFNIEANETGTFTIDYGNNISLFVADNTGASFKNLDKFDINKDSSGGRGDISDGTVNISTGTRGLDINNSALTVVDNSISIKGNLAYVDGTEGEARILLAENSEGQAEWVDLTPVILHKTFNVLTSIGEITKASQASNATIGKLPGPSEDFLTISEEVELEPGKWLITGTFFAFTNANTADDGGTRYNASTTGTGTGAGVIKITKTDTNEDVYITGVIPEVKSNGQVYLSASVAAYVDVVGAPQKFIIKAKGHSERGSSGRNDYYTYLLKGGIGSDFIGFDPKGRGNTMKAMRLEEYR